MGAVDKSELFGAEVVDQVLLIEVDQIDEGDRLRAVDPVWAEALGHMMAREGQKKTIDVCREPGAARWTLVDGAHRLAGARMKGLVYLRAEVVSADREERRLREILAQLAHRGLTDPLDRAAFIAELVQIKRAQAGFKEAAFRDASVPRNRAISEEAAMTSDTMSNVYGWSDEVGDELGFSGRTIRRDLLIYRMLPPSLVARLRKARPAIARNATQLRALAKLEEGKQRRIVERLENYPGVSFPEALATVNGKVPTDPEAKRLSAFVGAFARMGIAEKKGALAQLAGMLPAGFRLVEGEQPTVADRAVLTEYEAERIFVGVRDALFYHGLTKPEATNRIALDNWRDAGDRLNIAEAIAKRFAAQAGERAA